jgi:c-di-GMP-binding flagellar brake protein YcgR
VTPVHIALPGGAVEGRTEDISEGGLLVIARDAFEPSVRVVVRFALPIEGRVVSCPAHLRWARSARPDDSDGAHALGLEFIDPPLPIRESVARYVQLMADHQSGKAESAGAGVQARG